MGLSNQDDHVTDWEQGKLFLSADCDIQSDDRNLMNYVRMGSTIRDRDPTRLPYLGAKASKLKNRSQSKESRHYMNLLLNGRGLTTDFLLEKKQERKWAEIKRDRREKTGFNVKAILKNCETKPEQMKQPIFTNHQSP